MPILLEKLKQGREQGESWGPTEILAIMMQKRDKIASFKYSTSMSQGFSNADYWIYKLLNIWLMIIQVRQWNGTDHAFILWSIPPPLRNTTTRYEGFKSKLSNLSMYALSSSKMCPRSSKSKQPIRPEQSMWQINSHYPMIHWEESYFHRPG